MIIKIIPEEGDTIQEVEHKNIGDFFIIGNKKDGDEDVIDFHDWKGNPRYLIGSLAYFGAVIGNDMATSSTVPQNVIKPQIELKPPMEDVEVEVAVEAEGVETEKTNVIQLDPKTNKNNEKTIDAEAEVVDQD